MFLKTKRLAAPVLGALLVASAGFVTTASAAPAFGERKVQSAQTDTFTKIDHRRSHRQRGGDGWHEGRGHRHHTMGPRQIRRSLRHRGFHRIRIIDQRGPMYIIKAKGWRGQPMRLVVDSRTAHIVRSRPIGHRFHWQYRW